MRSYGRLPLLAGTLLLCAVAIPVSRRLLLPTPLQRPAAEAPTEVQRDYWRQRIKNDVSDTDAYVALGVLEERTGFSTSAIRYLTAARALGADDAKVSGPLGRALLALARDDEALPELVRAARAQPDSVDAVLNLAGLYVVQEQPAVATKLLKRFSDAHPALPPDAVRRLAYAQTECGNHAEAKRLANQLLATDADDLEAHSLAARSSLSLSDLDTARRHTEKLLVLSGGEASVHYLYGLILDGQGKTDLALAQWKATVEKNPNALDAHERLADTLYQQGDYAGAARYAEILARRAPNGFTVRRAAEACTKLRDLERAAYWRAVQVGLAGDFRAALSLGKIAAASRRPDVRRKGLQAVAEAYRGLGQKEAYLATVRQLTSAGTVDDLRLLARAYETLDRHEDRTACLRQAVEKASDAEKPNVLYALAQAYRRRGMRDEVEQALEEAVRRAPESAALQRELARTYFERRALGGRLEKAIAGWQKAIALDGQESSDWQYLGVAYAEKGELAKAASALEHAIDLEPGGGPAYLELGRVATKMGDKDGARRCNRLYAKYVAFDQERQSLRTRANRPGAPAADLIAYGDFLVKMNALDEATQQYEKAVIQSPKNVALRDKLGALYIRLRQPERRDALLSRAASAARPGSEVAR